MVASAKVYSSNTAETEKDHKFIQMGPGGSATGSWDNNGEYHSGGPSIEPVNWFIKHVQEPVLDYVAEEGFHIGYSANGDGTNGGLDVSVGPVEYNTNSGPKINPYIPTNQKTGYSNTAKPTAYRANAAGTASSIKQGGMTKDEIIDFNLRHSNETMMRGQ